VAALADRLLDAVRRSLAQEEWEGLRPSHLRLLGFVPPEGTTTTDLAPLLRMTKQAAGQFVGYLEGTGHLQVRTDGSDRRRRVVRRTERGDAAVAAVDARLDALEARWAERVGADRYRTFREVILELPDL
jgi:DNA-binding MarR family transcriptional regulator